MSTWNAPHASGPVRTRVRLPGSKSVTNRALVLAALSEQPSIIEGGLEARDTLLAIAALRALGTSVTTGTTSWAVSPGRPGHASVDVDLGNSGTCMRFLPGVAALGDAEARFDGDPRIAERPIGTMLGALRAAGVEVEGDAVPFTVRGHGSVRGGAVELDASGSSQLVSGLLLAAPRFQTGLSVRHIGPAVPSAPHISMTVRMLRSCGVLVEEHGGERPTVWRVEPGPVQLRDIVIEPDLSNAGPFLCAALVTGGTVEIPGWPKDSLQAAGQILDVLTRMGASVTVDGNGLTISGTGTVHGIEADLRDVNELGPVLTCVAATVADSPSVFTGLGHTRTHETDRLAALAREISALGGAVTEDADGLRIWPARLTASRPFDTYDDHRMVMAAAVLGLAVPGLEVLNVETVGKTFPSFTQVWESMLT
jgi:3-phosphoshikimate 1-carboxyvinyltransferase